MEPIWVLLADEGKARILELRRDSWADCGGSSATKSAAR